MQRWTWCVVVMAACGGSDGGGGSSGSSSGVGESSSAAASESGAATSSSGDPPGTSSSAAGSESAAPESSSDEGSTGGMVVCEPPITASACGNPNSIVRGTVTVGDGMPQSGDLLVALTHQYLGQGAAGGVYHISGTIPAVDFAAGAVPFELDMCVGGEMWSEENCEYQIALTLDANGNGAIDPGEPTGTTFVFLSCTGDNPCLEIPLDCTDGSSCLAFADPAYCGCPGNGASCNSPIVAC